MRPKWYNTDNGDADTNKAPHSGLKGSVRAMSYLFEKQDSLNTPIECFRFDAADEQFPIRPHWHYFAEFIYMLRGSAEITSDERSYTVSEGELMLLHPSAVHSIFPAGSELPVYQVIKADLSKLPGRTSYAPAPADIFRYARSEDMPVYFSTSAADMMHCREIFSNCIKEAEDYLFGVDVMLRSGLYQLIYGIIRSWIGRGLNIGSCPVTGDSYGIENITEYIDSRLDESLKVSTVAEKCHMSYSAFAARFRELYGISCKEYIERMRIFKAEEYLLFTDQDLNFISQQTGFSDCSHFIRSFKKYRGITPKQFRLQGRHH